MLELHPMSDQELWDYIENNIIQGPTKNWRAALKQARDRFTKRTDALALLEEQLENAIEELQGINRPPANGGTLEPVSDPKESKPFRGGIDMTAKQFGPAVTAEQEEEIEAVVDRHIRQPMERLAKGEPEGIARMNPDYNVKADAGDWPEFVHDLNVAHERLRDTVNFMKAEFEHSLPETLKNIQRQINRLRDDIESVRQTTESQGKFISLLEHKMNALETRMESFDAVLAYMRADREVLNERMNQIDGSERP